MTQNRSRRVRRRHAALLLALTLVAAACSGNDESQADGGASEAFEETSQTISAADSGPVDDASVAEEDATAGDAGSAAPESAPEGQESSLGSGGTGIGSLTPVDLGRDIIFTASIGVEVEDVAAASTEAVGVIQRMGGFVFGQSTVDDGVPRSTLTFKVRPEDFQAAVAALGEVGILRTQTISTDDVTERVVDLESRIITAQASVDRLRGFLEGATSLADIAQLETELLQRETDLELLRGQLRTVQAQVDLATITLSLTQQVPGPEIELTTTFYVGHDDGVACQGTDELAVDEGDHVTVCFVVTNSGDTHLDQIEVSDATLGLDADDITAIDDVAILAPGAQVRFFGEVEAAETRSSQSRATGRAVDAAGNDLRQELVTAAGEARLDVEPDTSLPGFLEGFSAGWQVVQGVVAAAVLVAGFALPLLWLPLLLWFLWRRVLAPRRARRAAARAAAPTFPGQSTSGQSTLPPPVMMPPAPVATAHPNPAAPAVASSDDDRGPEAPTTGRSDSAP